jgi:DNA-directed RNA polymerase specialized sigma24 family protein
MKIELTWVDALLSRWGRWSIRCESGALGFASSCILGGGPPDGDAYDSSAPLGVMDDDMEAVDGAVRKLPKMLQCAVIEVYQFSHGKSDRAIAAILGVHVDTMRKYILTAHRQIALDIALPCAQNTPQSANRGSCLERKQPVTA